MNARLAPGRQAAKSAATRQKLVDAAIALVRAQGYNATSIDQLCAHAGVTKGAFFHHFANKDALAAEAARYWGRRANAMFGEDVGEARPDPLDRVLAYVDQRSAMMDGTLAGCSCYAGTTVQEAYDSSMELREACREAIFGHAASLEPDIEAALEVHGVEGVSAPGLALHIQAVIQGAFVIAKADGGFDHAHASMAHLRRYIELLFKRGKTS